MLVPEVVENETLPKSSEGIPMKMPVDDVVETMSPIVNDVAVLISPAVGPLAVGVPRSVKPCVPPTWTPATAG